MRRRSDDDDHDGNDNSNSNDDDRAAGFVRITADSWGEAMLRALPMGIYSNLDRRDIGLTLPAICKPLRDDRRAHEVLWRILFRRHWPSLWFVEAAREVRSGDSTWKSEYKRRHVETRAGGGLVGPTDSALIFHPPLGGGSSSGSTVAAAPMRWDGWNANGDNRGRGERWRFWEDGKPQARLMTPRDAGLILFSAAVFVLRDPAAPPTGLEASGDVICLGSEYVDEERYYSAKGYFTVAEIMRILLARFDSRTQAATATAIAMDVVEEHDGGLGGLEVQEEKGGAEDGNDWLLRAAPPVVKLKYGGLCPVYTREVQGDGGGGSGGGGEQEQVVGWRVFWDDDV